MILPEIEKLISKAIQDRPKVTLASMNLYFYNGQIICGARSVMPQKAVFIAHVPPDRLEKGFNEKEWKIIVEKTDKIINANPSHSTNLQTETPAVSHSTFEITADNSKLEERRAEERLKFRNPVLFSKDLNGSFKRGQMLDISSGGMAFTCFLDGDINFSNGEIVTKFQVPRYKESKTPDMVSFNRIGRICRINQVNSSLHSIAIQFSKPLTFKPAQLSSKVQSAQNLLTTSL